MEEQIQVLNKMGFNIVKIINPIDQSLNYYFYEQFVPVDTLSGQSTTQKHKIKGRDITRFLNSRANALHVNYSSMEENTIRTQINQITFSTIEYSSHFLWVNYIS